MWRLGLHRSLLTLVLAFLLLPQVCLAYGKAGGKGGKSSKSSDGCYDEDCGKVSSPVAQTIIPPPVPVAVPLPVPVVFPTPVPVAIPAIPLPVPVPVAFPTPVPVAIPAPFSFPPITAPPVSMPIMTAAPSTVPPLVVITLPPVAVVVDSTKQVFESTVVLTVSNNINLATELELTTIGQNFVDSYNLGQADPSVCDPFNRTLTGVVKIQPAFTYSRRRGLEVEDNNSALPAAASSSEAASSDRDLQFVSSRLNFRNSPPILNGFSSLMLVVSGTCSDCEATSDAALFDDVSGRRLVEDVSSDRKAEAGPVPIRSLQTYVCDPLTATSTSTTETAVLDILTFQNEVDGLSTYEVSNITQISERACALPINEFGLDTYTFKLTIPPLDFPKMTFHDTMYHLTALNNFGEYFNDYSTRVYCDPLYRRITVSNFVGAEVHVDHTIMTFIVGGTCNGCTDLWGGLSTRRQLSLRRSSSRSLKSNKVRRLTWKQQQKQRQEERKLQGTCYCNQDVEYPDRGPIQMEFETYMSEKFFELALTSTPRDGDV